MKINILKALRKFFKQVKNNIFGKSKKCLIKPKAGI